MFKAINPNWHPLFVHFPLALLILGVSIELLAFLWPKSAMRTAARWMLLLGALAAVPTITTGIYAFANAASGSTETAGGADWSSVVARSHWGTEQWSFMRWHIILNVAATGAILLVAVAYLAASDHLRRRWHYPSLILLAAGVAAMAVGAWFSGEAVYRHRVAVVPPAGLSVPAGNEVNSETEHEASADEPLWGPRVQHYIPPLAVHTLLAGLVFAAAFAGVGTILRNWSVQTRQPEPTGPTSAPPAGELRGPVVPAMPGSNRPDILRVEPPRPLAVQPPAAAPPSARVPSGRFWVLAFILAICTGLAGLWFTEHGNWRFPEMGGIYGRWFTGGKMAPDDTRLAVHGVLGAGIVLLAVILALFARFSRRGRIVPGILLFLLLAAIGLQIWVGVLLLYNLKPTLL